MDCGIDGCYRKSCIHMLDEMKKEKPIKKNSDLIKKYRCIHRDINNSEHYWKKWEDAKYNYDDEWIQFRECERCGIVEQRFIYK